MLVGGLEVGLEVVLEVGLELGCLLLLLEAGHSFAQHVHGQTHERP